MKQIIILIVFLMLLKCAGAQWEPGASVRTYKILNDTTRIYSQRTDGRGNELIIKNSTFLTGQGGVLTNTYRGRSYWKKSAFLTDSTFNVGDDVLSIPKYFTLVNSTGGGGGDTNFIRNQYTHREAKVSWYDTAMLQRIRMSSATLPQVMVMEGNGGFLWRRTNSNGAAFNISTAGLANGRIQFSADYNAGSGAGKSPILRIIDTAGVNVWELGSGGMIFHQNNGSILRLYSGNPGGGIANTASLFVENVSSSAELKVTDAAGNTTVISPHAFTLTKPSDPMAWSHESVNERIGYEVNVDMYLAIKTIEKQSKEIEEMRHEIAKLKGIVYKERKPVKLLYKKNLKTGQIK